MTACIIYVMSCSLILFVLIFLKGFCGHRNQSVSPVFSGQLAGGAAANTNPRICWLWKRGRQGKDKRIDGNHLDLSSRGFKTNFKHYMEWMCYCHTHIHFYGDYRSCLKLCYFQHIVRAVCKIFWSPKLLFQ